MKARIQKWGNSLAVRIPRSFAAEVHLEQDSIVELSLLDDKLILSPARKPEVSLEELLARVTDENLHREVETGAAIGDEAW
jgi:antitoxin MazE